MGAVTWPAWLLLLGIAAAPLLPLAYVSGRLLAHARSLWLLGVLTGGIVWVAQTELWLALLGLWWLIRWPRHPEPWTLMPALLRWLGVAGAWGLLLAIPKELLAWAPWGWLLVAWGQSLTTLSRRLKWGGRQKGEMGSPVLTALYLALVSPFCPIWGWPILGMGLVLIFSFHALVGLAGPGDGVGSDLLLPRPRRGGGRPYLALPDPDIVDPGGIWGLPWGDSVGLVSDHRGSEAPRVDPARGYL